MVASLDIANAASYQTFVSTCSPKAVSRLIFLSSPLFLGCDPLPFNLGGALRVCLDGIHGVLHVHSQG